MACLFGNKETKDQVSIFHMVAIFSSVVDI
jgi:hypothetical protein